ncbi:hypothetical protein CEXT_158161 [Caerostris extrusa]|uniref:Uncharacterized protein n=1 Tax=Caerostris extrusa TaxID=172846 RepID=A0AAV4XCQ7_CAEEX|nr:hypothetical protein CEXT_158161 [Caerostris extrusa]
MTRLPGTQSLDGHSDGHVCACNAILINTRLKFGASDALTAPLYVGTLDCSGECLEPRGGIGGVNQLRAWVALSPVSRGGKGDVAIKVRGVENIYWCYNGLQWG